MAVVLDASTALSAVLPDENSNFGRTALAQALREELLVPTLWFYDVQNGLAMACRNGRFDNKTAEDALAALRLLPARVKAPRFGQEFALARNHALTAYDAAYLAVALRADATLATLDRELRRGGC